MKVNLWKMRKGVLTVNRLPVKPLIRKPPKNVSPKTGHNRCRCQYWAGKHGLTDVRTEAERIKPIQLRFF